MKKQAGKTLEEQVRELDAIPVCRSVIDDATGCQHQPMTPTPAEQLVDRILAEQRAKGRNEYGKGLDHRDAYEWSMEALRELIDAVQYLAAENLRLQEAVADSRAVLEACATELLHRGADDGSCDDPACVDHARGNALRLVRKLGGA